MRSTKIKSIEKASAIMSLVKIIPKNEIFKYVEYGEDYIAFGRNIPEYILKLEKIV